MPKQRRRPLAATAQRAVVEFTGAQPTILVGATGTRYTFMPGNRLAVDRRDLAALTGTNLVKVMDEGQA